MEKLKRGNGVALSQYYEQLSYRKRVAEARSSIVNNNSLSPSRSLLPLVDP